MNRAKSNQEEAITGMRLRSPAKENTPDDVVFSILSKLPLKSVKRFTGVCKAWAHLLEVPYFMSMFRTNFIHKHHSYYDDTSLLLLQRISNPPTYNSMMYLLSGERFEKIIKLDWPPAFHEDDPYILILGSCIHGTLCLYESKENVILWNQTTAEFKTIPISPTKSIPYTSISISFLGFGYDHVKCDFKVIREVEYMDSFTDCEGDYDVERIVPESYWEIYSLRSNFWKKLIDVPTRYFSHTGSHLYLNDACHWLGENWWGDEYWSDDSDGGCEDSHSGYEACLVSFNLSTEISFTTPLSFNLSDKRSIKYTSLLNGSIAIISYRYGMTFFDISILGQLGVKESWTKLFNVGPLLGVDHPIGIGKNGDIFFRKKNDEIARFDLSTQSMEDIGVKGQAFHCEIVIYKKSILPIV